MTVSLRDRLPLILGVLALLSLATAAFIRPQPLPPGVAKFPNAAVADPARPPVPGRTYALDVLNVNGKQILISSIAAPVPVRRGDTIRVSGWVLDSHTMQPASALLGGFDTLAQLMPVGGYLQNRPDVVAALHDDGAYASGFLVDFSLAHVSRGRHLVRFATVGADGRTVMLPTGVPIDVK